MDDKRFPYLTVRQGTGIQGTVMAVFIVVI